MWPWELKCRHTVNRKRVWCYRVVMPEGHISKTFGLFSDIVHLRPCIHRPIHFPAPFEQRCEFRILNQHLAAVGSCYPECVCHLCGVAHSQPCPSWKHIMNHKNVELISNLIIYFFNIFHNIIISSLPVSYLSRASSSQDLILMGRIIFTSVIIIYFFLVF